MSNRNWVMSLCALSFVVLTLGCNDSGSSSGTTGDGSASDGLSSGGANGSGNNGGSNQGTAGTAGLGGAGGSTVGDALSVLPPGATCAIANAQCSDGKDNDGDQKADALDPECTGPCDNDEGTFATGISGDNIDACKQDCFFDGNSGMGDDGCDWNLKCDPKNPGGALAKACPYDANYKNCPNTQSKKCTDNCRRVTPNGCDCFGCCAIPSGNTIHNVILLGACTIDKLNDPKVCPPCTQQTACLNTCEKCEICIGKPTLPADCAANPAKPDGGVPVVVDGGMTPYPEPYCEANITSCGLGGDVPATGCPAGQYCTTGCCIFPID
jgi:hypothetical protein